MATSGENDFKLGFNNESTKMRFDKKIRIWQGGGVKFLYMLTFLPNHKVGIMTSEGRYHQFF